ncbi:hypothetical protein QY95_00094 [Bacillus thermotolerans]|uniref:Uncharacterized protein n=1 Tax=Bacillus thermotolerans TaxID=1221996 RepID=A0A0F5IAA1_BACTR|nr:hypothetical protein QY95_00094 [Bacillus thermotolerans]
MYEAGNFTLHQAKQRVAPVSAAAAFLVSASKPRTKGVGRF